MRRTSKTAVALIVFGLALATIGTFAALSASAGGQEARATLRNATGNVVGTVKLESENDGKIALKAVVWGLAPGFHGFHIHTVGVCDPTIPAGQTSPFTSAGGHFNPTGTTHAGHAGDQPVLLVNADGTGQARFTTDRYTIESLFDADGSAFIVHAAPDNYANIPTRYSAAGVQGPDAATLTTGDAGARSACGVIGR